MFSHNITLAPPLSMHLRPAQADAPVGFAAGTLLRTIIGPRRVQQIMAGDLLLDVNGQILELRSIRKLQTRALVHLRAATQDAPDLIVGAGQKIGMRDWRTDLIFGKRCLSPARSMIDGQAVRNLCARRTLYQLNFDRDVVIDANGHPALVKRDRP